MEEKKEITGRAKSAVARANSLTSEQRSDIARKGALAKKAKYEASKPLEAIKKGNFKDDFGFDAECYVLNDAKKTAVMSQRGMATALGIKSTSGTALISLIKIKAIAGTPMGAELLEKLSKPLIFKGLSMGENAPPPRPANGFDVALLIDICKAVIAANTKGALSDAHKNIVLQANVILGATANLGIQTLVYKLTGYDASKEEVIAAFKAFVQEEVKKYESEFPVELYLEWARLYGHKPQRSWRDMHLTIDHVYYPLAKSDGKLLRLLRDAKNSAGGKNTKLFQFLNEVGARALRFHLGRIFEIAGNSPTREIYEAEIAKKFGGQTGFNFEVPTA